MSAVAGPCKADLLYLVELRRRCAKAARMATWFPLDGTIPAMPYSEERLVAHALFSHFLEFKSLGLVSEFHYQLAAARAGVLK